MKITKTTERRLRRKIRGLMSEMRVGDVSNPRSMAKVYAKEEADRKKKQEEFELHLRGMITDLRNMINGSLPHQLGAKKLNQSEIELAREAEDILLDLYADYRGPNAEVHDLFKRSNR